MPMRRQALAFIRTYVVDAGSVPTRIVAKQGTRPDRSRQAETTGCRLLSLSSATRLPSSIKVITSPREERQQTQGRCMNGASRRTKQSVASAPVRGSR